MKTIRFKKLSLLNFCGTRQAEYEFGDYVTIVSGGNGLGKTTLYNAITYCLFGKSAKGLALDIKTYDKHHNIIKEIPHEVTLLLSVDNETFELKRTLTDVWKGEQVTNTYKYYIDGSVVTAGDYKKCVDGICPEVTFRLCSSATDFTSRPWADQRKFLEALVPSITSDTITQGDHKFDLVVDALEKESIDKVVHHIKYKRKEVQDALNKIPVRLAELDKALPEAHDWDALEAKKSELNEKLVSLDNQIQQIRTGGADKAVKDGIRTRIEFTEKRKRFIERGASELAADLAVKHQSDVISANAEYAKAKSMVEDLQAKMGGYTDTEIHVKQQKEECERKVKDFNERMNGINTRSWEWNDKDSYCPHCLQPLPIDKLRTMKEESLKRFNEDVAEEKKQLQEDFGKLQQTYTELKKMLEQLDEDRRTTTNQLVKAQQALKLAEKQKAEVDAEIPQTYEQILAEKEEYQVVMAELEKLEQDLQSPSYSDGEDNQGIIKELEEQRTPVNLEYNEVFALLATKKTHDSISALIEEAKKDKRNFQEQLDSFDEQLDIANEYYQQSCSILEDSINEKFSYVKWTLFQSTQDGEKKPFCECYHDGVPHCYLNGAAKINAGIDIANTISKFYGVSVPMILDECESNLHPIYEGGQQIRLCVSPTDGLMFDYWHEPME